MGTLEGWLCPATPLDLGPLDALLADAPPEGYAAPRPTIRSDVPRSCSADRRAAPRRLQHLPGGPRRFDAHSAAVRATMERLNAESRVWLQRSADTSASARPVFAELAEVGHAYGDRRERYAAATALCVSVAGAALRS